MKSERDIKGAGVTKERVARGTSSGPAPKTRKRSVKDKAVQGIANHPLIAEVVAATLVAAAAALRDPAKARQLAAAAADEIAAAGSGVADKGGEFWQLALDVARRSVETMGIGTPRVETKKKKSKKAVKKAKRKKKSD